MTKNPELTFFIKRIEDLLSYDAETGVFTWQQITSNRARVGSVAGNLSGGYREISIDGKSYRAHRLAWLLTYGVWPSCYLDHINGIPDDNRLSNLREASASENARNVRKHVDSRSGLKGATYCANRHHKPWQARICVNKKTRPLGWYSTAEEAHAAYVKAAAELHGPFARVA